MNVTADIATRNRVIDALLEVGQPILYREFNPDCCVAAARHGQEALAYFGIEARPLKTQTIAGNKEWRDWMEAGMQGDRLPDEAWSVGIDIEWSEDRRYPGHLVLTVDDHLLLDLSLGQFSRPAKGMTLPDCAAFVLDDGWAESGDAGFYVGENVVVYRSLPEVDWTDAPDWKRKPPYAGEMIRAMRSVL